MVLGFVDWLGQVLVQRQCTLTLGVRARSFQIACKHKRHTTNQKMGPHVTNNKSCKPKNYASEAVENVAHGAHKLYEQSKEASALVFCACKHTQTCTYPYPHTHTPTLTHKHSPGCCCCGCACGWAVHLGTALRGGSTKCERVEF